MRPTNQYITHHITLEIASKQKNQTTNPTRYGKPKRSSAEKDARSVMPGRSLVIRMYPEWENHLDEPLQEAVRTLGPTGGQHAYVRYVFGEGLRVIE